MAGVTLVEPFAGKLPNPAMFTEVALVVVQLRRDVPPLAMVLGCALIEITGGAIEDTITVVDAGVVPPQVAPDQL